MTCFNGLFLLSFSFWFLLCVFRLLPQLPHRPQPQTAGPPDTVAAMMESITQEVFMEKAALTLPLAVSTQEPTL